MLFTVQVLLPAFLACLVLTGLLSYLGLHVLAREVIFVDIALAQIAALGTAVASYVGVEPHTYTSYVWSLGFTVVGAGIFAATRVLRKSVPQEAFIGVTYAVASAVTILVANALPHGDEEIKEILVGSLLTIDLSDVAFTAVVFAAVGAFHVLFRRRFLSLSFDPDGAASAGWIGALSDFAFYVSFGVVITSAVQMAGVLLVFSFLIVPAVFSALFSRRLLARLVVCWSLGAIVSAVGLFASFKLDVPTGATVVVTFGIALGLGAVASALVPRRNHDESAAGVPVTAPGD